jgi:hypothetical protein
MGAIRPLRVGISASALAMIGFGIWFFATDQNAEIRREAFKARDESLAEARASEKGVPLSEFTRLANSACTSRALSSPGEAKAASPGDAEVESPHTSYLDLWNQSFRSNSGVSIEECIENYLYGDDQMYEPTYELLKLRSKVVATMILIAGAAGAATAGVFIGAPWVIRSWWVWLRGN